MTLNGRIFLGSLIGCISACTTLDTNTQTDTELAKEAASVSEKLDLTIDLSCEDILLLQHGRTIRREGETPTCNLPANKEIAHACSWETFDHESGEPELSFGIRNENCSFSDDKQTRAICTFEYIISAYLGYGRMPPETPDEIWQSGRARFTNMTWGNLDEVGHLIFFTSWEADQDCRK